MKIHTSTLTEQTGFYGADRTKVIEREAWTVLLLADGAGGMSGAKQAAEFSITTFANAIEQMDAPPDIDDLEKLARELDQMLLQEPNTGISTFVAVFVTPQQLYGVSVGDSRCWHYTELYQLELTAHQYRKPLLGTGQSIPVAFGPFACSGTLLVGSDGLFDYVRQSLIDEVMQARDEVKAIPRKLLDIAKKNNAKLIDDIAVIVCRIEHEGS